MLEQEGWFCYLLFAISYTLYTIFMNGAILIFIFTLMAYIPLAMILLYVWWKYGNDEAGVSIARGIFLMGSFALIGYMIII
jgi:hypothetical protein